MNKARHVLYLLRHIYSMTSYYIIGFWSFLVFFSILYLTGRLIHFGITEPDLINYLPPHSSRTPVLGTFILMGWYMTLAEILGTRTNNESPDSPRMNSKKGMSFYRLLPLEMGTLSLTLAIAFILPLAWVTFTSLSVAALSPSLLYCPVGDLSEANVLSKIQEYYPGIEVEIQKLPMGENCYRLIGLHWYDALDSSLQAVFVGIVLGMGFVVQQYFQKKNKNFYTGIFILLVIAYLYFESDWTWTLVCFSQPLSALVLLLLLVTFFLGSKWYLEKEML